MDEIQRRLQLANERLQAGNVGVKIYLRGRREQWLYLRATMPPKPGSTHTRPFQQWLALKMRAQPGTIKEAELTARAIGLDLARGTFDWRKFSDWAEAEAEQRTIGHWIAEMERLWWATRDRANHSHQNTWRVGYASCLKTLPAAKDLSEALLIDWVIERLEAIERSEATRRRGHYVTCAQRLLKTAGMPASAALKELAVGYSMKPVNPRDLPTDAAIGQYRDEIKDDRWRWIFSVLAVYGLRPHEVADLDLSAFPTVRTHERTKTGKRAIEPLYPEWAAWCEDAPDLGWGDSNEKNGARITRWFKTHFGWSAYNLRHAYARRCVEFGFETYVSAKLMGHSESQHNDTYRAWIGDRVFLDRVRSTVARSDRPKPPLPD